MSEEEKQAIEEAKIQIENVHNLNNISIFMTDSSVLKILLNLINRLQKENEEFNFKLKEKICIETHRQIQENFVSKDKIKQLLKQVNSSIGHFKATDSNNIMFRIKDRLEDLLKEN